MSTYILTKGMSMGKLYSDNDDDTVDVWISSSTDEEFDVEVDVTTPVSKSDIVLRGTFNEVFRFKKVIGLSTVTRGPHKAYLYDLIELVKGRKSNTAKVSLYDNALEIRVLEPSDGKVSARKLLEEFKRVEDSDLNYPIIVDSENNDVYDGLHRLIKANMKGIPAISVVGITFGEFLSVCEAVV